jgi:steroid 5-alpha reductase family enzyme
MKVGFKTKLYLAIIILILIIENALPLFIKHTLIIRIFQVVLFGIMSLMLIDSFREKNKRKETINYLGLAVVIIYGIILYLIIKKYG